MGRMGGREGGRGGKRSEWKGHACTATSREWEGGRREGGDGLVGRSFILLPSYLLYFGDAHAAPDHLHGRHVIQSQAGLLQHRLQGD